MKPLDLITSVAVIAIQFFVTLVLLYSYIIKLQKSDIGIVVAMPIAHTLGVWGVGMIAARLRGTFATQQHRVMLVGTALGSAIGVVSILTSHNQSHWLIILLSPFGSMIGYYLSARVRSEQ